MPVHGKDGRPNGLLQQLGYPPVVFRIKRTNRDSSGSQMLEDSIYPLEANSPCTAGHSKLVFFRAPFDIRRCSVNPEQYQRGFPNKPSSLRIGLLLPHISISVLRTGNNTVGIRSPINRRDQFVVLMGGSLAIITLSPWKVAHFRQGYSGYPL